MTFTTEPAPLPSITETTIEELTPTRRTSRRWSRPNRWDASWLFEWGETTAYGTLHRNGTDPARRRHRIPADRSRRSPAWNRQRSTTSGPSPSTSPASQTGPIRSSERRPRRRSTRPRSSAVGQTTAHLSSRVIANSAPTDVHFEYGPIDRIRVDLGSVVAIGSDDPRPRIGRRPDRIWPPGRPTTTGWSPSNRCGHHQRPGSDVHHPARLRRRRRLRLRRRRSAPRAR